MIDPAQFFDSYSRQARLYPALLTLLPPLMIFVAYFPKVLSIGQTVVVIAATCGILFFLADFARTQGKRIEPLLLQEWGGWPSTVWLRHRDTHLPAAAKNRYHAFLSRQPSIGPLPTPEDEMRNSTAADEAYAASALWLKERCRGTAFPLVEKENATYGFRRNLLGLKPVGITLCVATVLTPLVTGAAKDGFDFSRAARFLIAAYFGSSGAVLAVVAVSMVVLVLWFSTVNRNWVRQAGDQYARALLANCDSL